MNSITPVINSIIQTGKTFAASVPSKTTSVALTALSFAKSATITAGRFMVTAAPYAFAAAVVAYAVYKAFISIDLFPGLEKAILEDAKPTKKNETEDVQTASKNQTKVNKKNPTLPTDIPLGLYVKDFTDKYDN